MVLGWRRAFCTSISKDQEKGSPIINEKPDPNPKPKSRFSGFFSEPSTPRPSLRCRTTAASNGILRTRSLEIPKLHCKTKSSPRFFNRSAPSSPRSPSAFSLLKSSLRISKSRCGICLQGMKTGQGTAIFTAECGHSFHFPCISSHVKKLKQGTNLLTCPICNFTWKEMNHFNLNTEIKRGDSIGRSDSISKSDKKCVLKVYNDDEPLSSPTSGARFNPIPEFDESEEGNGNEEFPGFFANKNVVASEMKKTVTSMEVALLSEAAVVSVGKTSETYAVVLKLKAPAAPVRRAPIDLVTVLDVSSNVAGEKLHLMRRVMRMVVSSLSAADRLSIVAFSTTSKRLLPLRRMNTAGRRSARRIIDAVVSLDGGVASATDALKKAAKVIEDRREKNPTASIMLLSADGHRSGQRVSSTRFSPSEIPAHSVNLSACLDAPPDDTLAKRITGLLSVVMQDLKVQLGFTTGSAPGEIAAVYSYTGRPDFLGAGSSWSRVGDLHSEEERELLIELKVPPSLGGAHRLLSFRCSYKDPSTQQTTQHDKERLLPIPRPRAVGSSTRDIQRIRCLFVTTRAVAESRRLAERHDVAGAQQMLTSARSLVLQSGSGSGEEFVRGLEAELADLNWRRQDQVLTRRRSNHEREGGGGAAAEEKADALTPTSAWRAAERLAKVAIMRKSLNRVSDLHGFENARF